MTLKILPMYCTGPENEILGPVDALCEVTQSGTSVDVHLAETVEFTNETGKDLWINACYVCLGPLRVYLPLGDGRTFPVDQCDEVHVTPSQIEGGL